MIDWGVFVAIIALSVVFAVIIGVVVLRFLTVIQQMKRADSMDRSELMHAIGETHGQAYQAALLGLEKVHSNVIADQMAMFTKTMDMVHGPQTPEQDGQPYVVDQPNMDLREAGQPSDDDDGMREYQDPTDDDVWLKLGSDVMQDRGPRTVSVPPGGSLIPGT